MNQDERLAALYDKYNKDPNFHQLRREGVNLVPGYGESHNPSFMLIGECPGYVENTEGKPFLGRTGKNLDTILKEAGLKDGYTHFITNCVKYWPRDEKGQTGQLTEEEMEDSRGYILEEIDIVNPVIIGLCGYYAIHTIFPQIKSVYQYHGELLENKFVPLYHPSRVGHLPWKSDQVLLGYTKLKVHLLSKERERIP